MKMKDLLDMATKEMTGKTYNELVAIDRERADEIARDVKENAEEWERILSE